VDATNGELVALVVATGFADRLVLLDERFAGEPTLMGVPCVTADVGDDAILPGAAGEVAPKQNSVALAAAMARLLDMPAEQRQTQGSKGRERVERESGGTQFR